MLQHVLLPRDDRLTLAYAALGFLFVGFLVSHYFAFILNMEKYMPKAKRISVNSTNPIPIISFLVFGFLFVGIVGHFFGLLSKAPFRFGHTTVSIMAATIATGISNAYRPSQRPSQITNSTSKKPAP